MTLSKRGDYVVRSALCLARAYDSGGYCKIREVVAEVAVPRTFASQILAELVHARLATSKAGKDGGYRLVRAPASISLLDVIEAGEGPLRAERCALGEGPCRWEAVCPLHETWGAATAVLRDTLAETSLATLAARDEAIEGGTYPVPTDSHRHGEPVRPDGSRPEHPVQSTDAPDGAALRLDVGREAALARAIAIVGGAWRSFDRFRPGQPAIADRVRELLNVGLPEAPTPVLDALNDVSRILDESIAQPRPRYFAFIGSSGLEIGVIADLLAACYDPNLAVDAAAATALEAQAGRWVAAFVGYPADCAAAFTSGGTVSNISALAAAREHALPRVRAEGMAGVRAAVYCSRDAHYSIVRAIEMLGIGANSLRSLPVDSRRRMIPEALAKAIDADLRAGIVPVAVVATAGTTLTGAVDPIDTIADICSERGVWLHVDGAYGLPAASVSTHAPLFVGVSRADSICVDAHKWLYVPKPCSVCIVRRPGDLIRTFGHDPHYLPRDRAQQHAVDMTLEYSRPLRALKLWLALRTHGAAAFRAAIAGNLRQAQLFHNEVTRYEDLEVFDEPQLSVVPFRHVPPGVRDLDSHNRRLALLIQKDGRAWVASAVIDGRVYLRPSFVNFRSTDTDVLSLIHIARELGARLAHKSMLQRG